MTRRENQSSDCSSSSHLVCIGLGHGAVIDLLSVYVREPARYCRHVKS